MRTIEELANSVIIIDDGSDIPFIIRKLPTSHKVLQITGNVFGRCRFDIKNDDEVLIFIGNPALIPYENLGKLKVICIYGLPKSHDCVILIPRQNTFVLSEKQFRVENEKNAFSTQEGWEKLKADLEKEKYSLCEDFL